MSSQTVRNATSNFLTVDTNRAKVFIGNNKLEVATLINATAGELTYPIGTVLGRVADGLANNGKVVPMASAATDGSQYPVGVLAEEVTLGAGAEISINMCTDGDVDIAAIILDGTDTLDTPVESKLIRDRIKSDTMGINLVTVNELTFTDN